jgi:hypothetical protein
LEKQPIINKSMKKTLLSAVLVVATAVGAMAQATISIDNLSNVNTDPAATSSGYFFIDTGSGPTLLTSATLNVEVWGGTSAGSLALITTLSGANALVEGAPGQYLDPAGIGYTVPGVASQGSASLQVYAWTGSATTYAQAVASGTAYYGVSTVFTNPTGGPGNPPANPASLVGMPSLVLTTTPVPEPSTFALAGLGLAGLLIFRRRK